MRTWFLALTITALASCSLNRPGVNLDTGTDAAPDPDSGPDGSTICPGPVHAVISVNGVTTSPPGDPFITTAVSDTVTLSAAGSCALQNEALTYQWMIEVLGESLPGPAPRAENTVLPDLTSRQITFYPTVDRQYRVTLTVTGAESGATDTDEEIAVEALGWRVKPGIENPKSPGAEDARGLAVGDGHLWIAGKLGAYRSSLGTPGSPMYEPLEAAFSGGSVLQPELKTIAYDAQEQIVWFGHKDTRQVVWMLRLYLTDPSFALPIFEMNNAIITDIDVAAAGVHLATDSGVYRTLDPRTVPVVFEQISTTDVNTVAVTENGTRVWAGAAALHDVTNDVPYDIFPGGDDKITDIAVDSNGMLWVTSDGEGVAQVDPASPTTPVIYSSATDDAILNDKCKAVAIDSQGDVWVATELGVARFKRHPPSRPAEWFTMGVYAGLRDYRNVRSIAIDESPGAPLVVYIGSATNILYLTAP